MEALRAELEALDKRASAAETAEAELMQELREYQDAVSERCPLTTERVNLKTAVVVLHSSLQARIHKN